ncbi:MULTISPECIES: SDR family NAD(P)-dependent oxidoreductase [unclassified Gordonia (in: high G+C Gram-positive bacteria)]|uniref:SDR family NAD(P)-dependent oxidoreductase n=1 Tax=unclassified Gordonia (in: high G+C Gram-positive bacteria) TaxID=2657482 RepID=UPI001F066534|nr:SDR family NAD(P)-dependent oxidoreductase [Gordonia sp. PDNC005]
MSGFKRMASPVWSARRGVGRYARAAAGRAVRLGALDLNGCVVLITGASSGIGKAVAGRCARAGATVVLVARSADSLAEAVDDIASETGCRDRLLALPCDVTDGADVIRAVAEVEARFGRIDVLVNNAGRSIRRATENSIERQHDYRRTMEVNFFGAVTCVLAVLPGMLERGEGRIVNVSSIGTQVRSPRFGAYLASKAALDMFGDVLAGEVASRGVTVSSVKMPLTRTPMIAPTGAYRGASTISANQAAVLVERAIVHGRPRVSTAAGSVAGGVTALLPGYTTLLRQIEFLAVPESAAALRESRATAETRGGRSEGE